MKRILFARLLPMRNFTAVEAAHWTTSVLVVAIGITLAHLTWRLLPQAGESAPPPLMAAATTTTTASPTQLLDGVVALHLFGQPALVGNDIQAPETHLNFTLHGLFASNDAADSFAIIASGNGADHIYRIGDKLGGATIHAILPNRVILERSGHYETLTLPKFRLAMAAVPATATSTGNDALNPATAQQLNQLRQSILGNPQKLFNLATFQPVFSHGQLLGYRIQPRAQAQLFRAAGLSPQDIVTEVNGIPVTDPRQLGAITAQLSNATELQIGIERPDGSRGTISINLN